MEGMEEKVFGIIATVVGRSPAELRAHGSAEDLWDSFSKLEIIINLEAEFAVSFTQEEIALMNTPKKIIELMTGKMKR